MQAPVTKPNFGKSPEISGCVVVYRIFEMAKLVQNSFKVIIAKSLSLFSQIPRYIVETIVIRSKSDGSIVLLYWSRNSETLVPYIAICK